MTLTKKLCIGLSLFIAVFTIYISAYALFTDAHRYSLNQIKASDKVSREVGSIKLLFPIGVKQKFSPMATSCNNAKYLVVGSHGFNIVNIYINKTYPERSWSLVGLSIGVLGRSFPSCVSK